MTVWTLNIPDEKVSVGVLRIVVDGVNWPDRQVNDMPSIIDDLEAQCGGRPRTEAASIVLYWNPKDLKFLQQQSPSGRLH